MYYSTEFVVVNWPESQKLEELAEDWQDHCYLIADEAGIETYGCNAYFVEKEWYINHLLNQ